MGAVSLAGSLVIGPTVATAVPGGTVAFSLATTPDPKTYSVSSHGTKNLASPTAAVALSGVGASDDVTTATFLFMRTTAAVEVTLTQGGTDRTVIVNGTFIMEFPSASPLTAMTVKGTALIEYAVAGDQ